MKRLFLVAIAAISAAALAQSQDSLPPGHPPLDGPGAMSASPGSAGPLPPGHPTSGPGAMPAGHPPIDGAGAMSSPPGGPGTAPPGHPPMRQGAMPPSADELLKRLDGQADLKSREKSFEVAVAVGKLYYASARYAEAAEYLGQAWAKADRARQLYLQHRKKGSAPAAPPPGCEDGRELTALTSEIEKRAAAGDAAGAAACGWSALAPALEAAEMRANALALTGNFKGAVSEYERVLQVDPKRGGSLYGRAMALLESRPDDVAALKAAKADLASMLEGAPPSPRVEAARRTQARVDQAIAAGGLTKLTAREEQERKAKGPPKTPPFVARMMGGSGGPAPSQPPQSQGPTMEQVRQMEEAARNMPRTPEVEQGFAQLVEQGEEHLARGRYQDALDNYKRVVPFQPENGRAKAGMAWAMVQLNKQPMADRVWTVAVTSDPAAMDKLGDTLRQKGDDKGARGVWAKLKESAPDYAASSGLARKLN